MSRFLGLEISETPAIVDSAGRGNLSFRELIREGRELAGRLGSSRQLLFITAANDVFSAVMYVGAVGRGHAVAMLDSRGSPPIIAELAEAYRPTWIAGPPGLASRLAESLVEIESASSIDGGELLRTAFRRPPDLHPDLALLLTTSGTTGSRKFVRLSARNLEANASSIARCLELTPEDRPITSLPIHYSFGLSVLNSHWLVGAPVVLSDESVLTRSFWDTFEAQRCTSLAGVPYTYQMLERLGFRDMELPSLRSLQQAGGALDRRLTELYAAHMAARGGRFYVMYGQTEATARMSFVPPSRLADKIGSAGLAIPDGRLSIDTGASGAAAAGSVGEVVYEGPNVMLGYATGSDSLADPDALEGVLRTGDLGYIDDEGFLFLVGRSRRIAKVFGRRINLDEVEVMAREGGPAAVVGAPDAIWVFCAFGTPDTIAEFGGLLAQRLKLHHTAVRARHVGAIPTHPSGKIDYERVGQWVP